MPPNPNPNPNPNPSPFQQFNALMQQVVPLMEEAYAFSQVVGHILVAADQTNGPPPTYYIGESNVNPSSPSQPQQPTPGNAPVPIASIGDQAGGLDLTGDGYQVYLGSSQNPIATVTGSYAGGMPVLKGSTNLGAGGTNSPVTAQGFPTAVGPITDVVDDGVYMGVDVSPGTPIKHALYNGVRHGSDLGQRWWQRTHVRRLSRLRR